MKNNVPFDVAESWDDEKRNAFVIIFGMLDGGDWDWSNMKWKKRTGS